MNNQVKAYSILLFILWPFSAVLIGIRYFDFKFARNLIIASFLFLGFTADQSGDLEFYAAQLYISSIDNIYILFNQLVHLKASKFFTDFSSIIFSVFNSHQIYFSFLFGLFGYFLVNSINILRIKKISKSNFTSIFYFLTFAFFYSIVNIFNYAFYMGAIYFLFYILKFIFSEKKSKYLFFIFLTPLFHIGLAPMLIIPFCIYLFKQNTKWYILLLILSTTLSQTFLITNLESGISESETVLNEKFKSYASSEGQESLELRYSEGYKAGNLNYKLSRTSKELVNYFAIPLILLFLYLNKKIITRDKISLDLFNISIACLSITSLMLNISQGNRFFNISGFMILAAFIYVAQKFKLSSFKYKILIYLGVPVVLLTNIISLIMAKNFIGIEFVFSNFPIQFYENP
jgi:hypothetical protein